MQKIRFAIFLFLFVHFFSIQAQQLSPAAKEVRQEIWGAFDKDFTATVVPEKWHQESAVVLGKSFRFEYGKKRGYQEIYQRIYLRERIKLLDKAAVEEYSEFKFKQIDQTWGDKLYFGIKVIKPDGKEKEIPLNESVKIETKQGSQTSSYQKLAIPDLVPGDIIDYYIFSKEILSAATTLLPPRSILLAGDYPIVRQKIVLAIDPEIYLNVRAFNNAPDFTYDQEEDLYILRDGNREKLEKSLWFYEYRSIPVLKFQVFFKKQTFTGKKGKAKFDITKEDILKYVEKIPQKNKAVTSFYKKFRAYLKANKKHRISNEEKLKEAYYFFRHQYQIAMLEQVLVYQQIDLNRIKVDKDFINIMAYLVSKYRLDYEVVLALPRKIANLEDWIIPEDIALLLKINGSKTLYLQNPVLYDYYGEVRPELQGVTGYSVAANVSPAKRSVKKIRLAEKSHRDHTSIYKTEIWMDENFKTLKVKQKVALAGANRGIYQSFMINPYDIISENFPKYGTKVKTDIGENSALRKRLDEERNQSFKLSLKNDYDKEILSLDKLTLTEKGMWDNKPQLRFESEFTMQNLTKKIGQNYIFEVGKLIGKQIDLKMLSKKRQYDVYMPYARSFKNELIIHLPNGYQVQGIDKLQKKVVNETGGFESSASLKNQDLIIKTYKYYSHNYESVKKWSQMEDFLKAAYQFTQQKLLLKKMK